MSLFSDLVNDVYSLTNRNDLVAETALAVKQEIQAAHTCDYFKQDMDELLIGFTSAAILQLSISSLFPQWRAFSYLRPYNTVTATPSRIMIGAKDFLAPDAIFDEYLIEKTNMAYVAGDNLNVKLEAAFDGMLVGYYKNPIIAPEGAIDSWIGRVKPTLIQTGAAERVFTMIGYEEAAARLRIALYGSERGATRANPTGGEYLQLKQSYTENFGR